MILPYEAEYVIDLIQVTLFRDVINVKLAYRFVCNQRKSSGLHSYGGLAFAERHFSLLKLLKLMDEMKFPPDLY